MPEQSPLFEMMANLPQRGRLEWIGLRPAPHSSMRIVSSAQLDQQGLIGDRYQGASGTRAVTLLQAEHLPVIASLLHIERVAPEMLRRNLLISGINLLALKNKQFSIGEALLEMSGLCQPCSRMERVFGPGGYNAIRGHGGITARVLRAGSIKLGDELSVYPPTK
jgi:MOSC domain-containing protein YiiM